ncbi:MAG: hypothetical protein Q4G39_04835 [Brachymonas sp.]|nr:hypothetical protein [Brachymonas sp.]
MRRILFACLLALAPALVSAQQAPTEVPDAVQQGTMANEQLQRDAMMGVHSALAARGCNAPAGLTSYVTRLPEGKAGARAWQEVWLVNCPNRKVPVRIDFRETGATGVTWSLQIK